MSGIFIGLAWIRSVPLWLVAIIFGRDVLLLIASALVLLLKAPADLRPSIYGKLSTLFQIGTAGMFIAANAAPIPVLKQSANLLIWPTAVATLISAFQYGIRGVFNLRRGPNRIDAIASRE